jgi:hypothetical protein
VLRTCNSIQSTSIKAAVKNYFKFFFAARISDSQRTGRKNTLSQNLSKSFLNFFAWLVFRTFDREGFLPKKTAWKTGTGASNSDSIWLFEAVEEPASEDDISTVLSHSIPVAYKAPIVSMVSLIVPSRL